jgi:hypothetical protein
MNQIIHSKDFVLNDTKFTETVDFNIDESFVIEPKYDFIKTIYIDDIDEFTLCIGGCCVLNTDDPCVNLLSSKFYKNHPLTLTAKYISECKRKTFIVTIEYQNFESYIVDPKKLILFDHDIRYWNNKQKLISSNDVVHLNNTKDFYSNEYIEKKCKLFNFDCQIDYAQITPYDKFELYGNINPKNDCLVETFEYVLQNIGGCPHDQYWKITFPIAFSTGIMTKFNIKNDSKIVETHLYINEKLCTADLPIRVFTADRYSFDILILEKDVHDFSSITVHVECLTVQPYLNMIAGDNLDEFKKIL